MKLEITKEILYIAKNHSKERIKFEYDRFKLNKKERETMIFMGTIGQLIFKEYLDKEKIDYEYEFQAGKYDDLDFIIGSKIIEIKTSGYDKDFSNLNLLYNYEQYKRGKEKRYQYCVQIFINGYDRKNKIINIEKCNEAFIAGYIDFNDIGIKYMAKNMGLADAYVIPLIDLKKINLLINNINSKNI